VVLTQVYAEFAQGLRRGSVYAEFIQFDAKLTQVQADSLRRSVQICTVGLLRFTQCLSRRHFANQCA
jgi:hypothetical protein